MCGRRCTRYTEYVWQEARKREGLEPKTPMSMTASGKEDDLQVYSDAGFAGADTHSQNGLVILWAGSVITWRSSRASLAALSTAEAELGSAAVGWQVTEGVRYFLSTLAVHPQQIKVWIDNKAALTAAMLGATWRTRYYAVRARRLWQENSLGRITIGHCPTKDMIADALTKLATPEVIAVLRGVMDGHLPVWAAASRTTVTEWFHIHDLEDEEGSDEDAVLTDAALTEASRPPAADGAADGVLDGGSL